MKNALLQFRFQFQFPVSIELEATFYPPLSQKVKSESDLAKIDQPVKSAHFHFQFHFRLLSEDDISRKQFLRPLSEPLPSRGELDPLFFPPSPHDMANPQELQQLAALEAGDSIAALTSILAVLPLLPPSPELDLVILSLTLLLHNAMSLQEEFTHQAYLDRSLEPRGRGPYSVPKSTDFLLQLLDLHSDRVFRNMLRYALYPLLCCLRIQLTVCSDTECRNPRFFASSTFSLPIQSSFRKVEDDLPLLHESRSLLFSSE